MEGSRKTVEDGEMDKVRDEKFPATITVAKISEELYKVYDIYCTYLQPLCTQTMGRALSQDPKRVSLLIFLFFFLEVCASIIFFNSCLDEFHVM